MCLFCCIFLQLLCIDVDDQCCQQDYVVDQDFQEVVDVDVVEVVVEYVEYEQVDDGVVDVVVVVEQVGVVDYDGGDGVQQVGVEFVLLCVVEMGDVQYVVDF